MNDFQNNYGNSDGDGIDQGKMVIEPKSRSKAWSVSALIVSILSLICCCFGWFGIICGVLGIVFAIISRRSIGYFDGLSIASIIVSIFGIVFGGVLTYLSYALANNPEFMELYQKALEEATREYGIESFKLI